MYRRPPTEGRNHHERHRHRVTLDGIVSDPDGSGGTPGGAWAFRHGPESLVGDKFRLGRTLDEGVLMLGRRTWELFSGIWPGRVDPFSARMNAVPKLVASRTLADVYDKVGFLPAAAQVPA